MNVKKLLGNRVLVDRDPEVKKTASGLIIPDAAKEKQYVGTVMMVGTREDGSDLSMKPNDRVVFGKFSGELIEVDGKEYVLMREDDIFAILEPGDEDYIKSL